MLFCCQNHSSLVSLLLICLLSHFCSSSESDSDSHKRKSGKKDKDKPKRYGSVIMKKKIAFLSPSQPFQVKHTATDYFTVNVTNPWTPEIFLECHCVATKPTNSHGNWFGALWLACMFTPGLNGDWSLHSQHCWNISDVYSFLSLTGSELVTWKLNLLFYFLF